MQPILTTLGDLVCLTPDKARKLARRAPDAARDLVRRLGDRYRTKRAPATAPSPPSTAAPVAPVAEPQINWELRSQAELVAHIEQHYHAGLRRDLPNLVADARHLEREHAGHPAVPAGLYDVLSELAAELESHMTKEETMLFPALRTNTRGGELDMPMRMMEREHDSHDRQVARIRELTRNLTAPADGSEGWTALYARLTALETDLRQHIYLENHVLFARATGGR